MRDKSSIKRYLYFIDTKIDITVSLWRCLQGLAFEMKSYGTPHFASSVEKPEIKIPFQDNEKIFFFLLL